MYPKSNARYWNNMIVKEKNIGKEEKWEDGTIYKLSRSQLFVLGKMTSWRQKDTAEVNKPSSLPIK